MTKQPRLVVRSYTPLRRALLTGGSLVLVLMALFVAVEWGRSNAGFDSRGARAELGELHDRIHDMEEDNRRQRLKLAAVETQRVGQAREREELARTIGGLQADVARLTRDLAFYRGVVGESANAPVVRVQQLRITRGPSADEYVLHLVLGRPLRPEDTVSGKARLTIEGASVLHQMFRIRWGAWRALGKEKQTELIAAASPALAEISSMRQPFVRA